MLPTRWSVAMVLAGLVLVSGALAQGIDLSPVQAERCESKARAVLRRPPGSSGSPVRTVFSEPEVNAYLKYRAHQHLPEGVTSPSVRLIGGGRVSARAIVDLDRVRRTSRGGWLDPTAYLTGTLPISLSGTVSTAGRRVRFVIDAADVNGIPVPPAFIQRVVSAYTRSPELPGGVRIDEAFDMPAGITSIDVLPSQAAVVQ